MITIEDLNKTQLILLTLLITFVTSIATGIITTTLLAEAPVSVSQTINRVVERTIETVAPATDSSGGIVKEVTIVKEEDAIIGTVEEAAQSVVRIIESTSDGSKLFFSLGIIISKEGTVLADGRNAHLGTFYSAVLSDGAILPIALVLDDEETSLATFKIQPDDTHKSFFAAKIAKSALKLGQSIVSIGGRENNTVAVGRVLTVNDTSIDTDITSKGEALGSPAFNLSGELVGIKISTPEMFPVVGAYSTLGQITKVLSK